jgi:assimilatory nitrate reductase catalytic subunit
MQSISINDQAVKTTCPYCGVGCGIEVTVNADKIGIKGDKTHPANFGKLCVKGTAVGETLSLAGRLLQPMVDDVVVSVEDAITSVADGFSKVIRDHGADAVAFYVSGQLLTEDYYVANKLIKGFIGTANIDTNSRLCMASAVVGYKRAFGCDGVPASYEDLDEADLLVLVGANAAYAHPILFQQMAQSKRNKPHKKVVLIDPRATATNDIADLHLPLKAGTDAYLFNGLLTYLAQVGALNQDYIDLFTQGLDTALSKAQETAPSIEQVATVCALSVESVTQFYQWFAETAKTVTFYSQGVNQSSSGVDKSNAIINVHLATGRVGQVGASPFSITGQPNAMGGREVGGLANQLAAHMDFNKPEDIDRVARFWSATNMAQANGLKAVDMFKAVNEGKIKAIWIMHTNPVVSMPDADFVRTALQHCPLVVISDNMANTDTVNLAHIKLPAAAWGEKDGTVTNSDRTISRQRSFLQMPENAKPDWWWIAQVAKRMGFVGFDYTSAGDVFREHAALSGFENDGVLSRRDFDISALQDISDVDYDALVPMQWPINRANPQGTKRLFSDGQFFTPNKKAHFIAITPRLPVEQPSLDYPFILNTGRYRDQWHTMTRTALAPRLMQHRSEPLLSIHPEDAQQLGVQTGDIVRVSSRLATNLLRVEYDAGLQRGNLFAPMHWTSVYASSARVDALIPAHTDALSGQPESKHAVVAVEKFNAIWQGWYLTRDDWQPTTAYWVKVPLAGVTLWKLADDMPCKLEPFLKGEGDVLRYTDAAHGIVRTAHIQNNRVQSVLFVAPKADERLPSADWVASLFAQESLTDSQRFALLSGQDSTIEDVGAMVCACFQVGQKTIQSAIKSGATTVEAVGACCQAGTNCGSCIPEIKALLAKGA